MLNKKQMKILDDSTATMWQELPFDVWVEMNTDNKSPELTKEINEYLKEKNVTKTTVDLRHLRKASRAKKDD